MKKMIFCFSMIFLGSTSAFAGTSPFKSLVCRSYDYYQLVGNRKTVEIDVTKSADGTYKAALYRGFETLLSNGQYKEISRTVEQELPGVTCLQADPSVTSDVISCSTKDIGSYFGLVRVDRTVIGSAFSSRPGQIIKTTVYEAVMFGNGQDNDGEDGQGVQNGLQFDSENCAVN